MKLSAPLYSSPRRHDLPCRSFTRIFFQGITGSIDSSCARCMVEFGTPIRRGGQDVESRPVFDTVADAVRITGATCSFIVVPAQAVLDAGIEAANSGMSLAVVQADQANEAAVPFPYRQPVPRACAREIPNPRSRSSKTWNRRKAVAKHLMTPKAENADRIVLIHGWLAQRLRALRKRQVEERLQRSLCKKDRECMYRHCKHWRDWNLVFSQPNG